MRWVMIAILTLGLATACGGDDSNGQADTVAVNTPTATESSADDQESTATIDVPTSTSEPTTDATATETPEPATAIVEASPTEEPEATATEEAVATDEDLQGVVLALEDLPVGWTTWGTADDDDEGLGICDSAPVSDRFESTARAEASYQQSNLGPFLTQTVTRYDSRRTAEEAIEYVKSMFTCSEWIDVDEDGEETIWRISPLSFPTVGDDTFVLRMNTDAGIAGSIEFDVVIFRVDDMISLLGHIGVNGVDSEQSLAFAELAAEKIRY